MTKIFATNDPNQSLREERNMKRARFIASQGMVLLKNNGSLPISNKTKKIALFGNGARLTVKGGSGSGDVNSRFVVTVEQGLEEAGFIVTTKELLHRYELEVELAKKAYFTEIQRNMQEQGRAAITKIFTDPFKEPPIQVVTEEEIKKADTDTAVYVLARNSGEGRDREPVAGDYELYKEEKETIAKLTENFDNLIIVLNVGGVVDTKFLRSQKGIGAVLLMSQAGNMGGHALVDVLTGKTTPSGHLATTWAQNYNDYPSAQNFSHINGNVDDEYYNEGIYVGYRYFDSFNITPAYPFGYGLSYTNFSIETEDIKASTKEISISIKVTNTGTVYSGKEVVQVYYSAPQGILEKPYQELVAYAKTKELQPSESEVMTITYPVEQMASYDVKRAAYVMEAGSYFVRVGNHSRNTKVVAKIELDKEVIIEVLKSCLSIDCKMKEITTKGVDPYCYGLETVEKEHAIKLLISAADFTTNTVSYNEENLQIKTNSSDKKITLQQVAKEEATLDDLVGQLTVAQMAELCVGTSRGGMGGSLAIGNASTICPGAAGDTTSMMFEDRDIRNIVLADGPAGLRLSRNFKTNTNGDIIAGTGESPMAGLELIFGKQQKVDIPEGAIDYYQYCTAIPIATLLAQTWDLDVIKVAGEIVGEEMIELGVTLWLAPGMNIHRNPLCGRNFEYYSEDPLVSGMCAAADTLGVQKYPGIGTTIKHYACNNQEDNRMHTNAHISERALREIYLKGFEIAVKASQPMAMMTSYNLINGTHTANSKDLIQSIARDEWGFAGIVMTDWGTTGGIEMNPDTTFKYDCSSAAGCIKAGNDLIMPGKQEDVDDIIMSVDAKESDVACPITKSDLQACAKHMLNIIMKSSVYEKALPYNVEKTGLAGYIKVVV